MVELIILENNNTTCKLIENITEMTPYLKQKPQYLWLNLEKPTDKEIEILDWGFNFHPLAIEDCMASIQRPKIDRYDNYLFIVLHAASLGPHKDKATSLELDVFVGSNYIVTVHAKPIISVNSIKDRCLKNPQLLAKGPAHLFYNIADALVDNYFPMLEKLDRDIDKTERIMFNNSNTGTENINRILSLKKTIMTLRRFMGPQRELINFLTRGDYEPFIGDDLSFYFRDIGDLFARVNDTLDSYRDILTNLLEGHISFVSNKLNEVMKVLTIIATIMMPLTLISGIYGMNFKYMPELNWRFGYFLILGLMLFLGIVMMIFFKRKKWL